MKLKTKVVFLTDCLTDLAGGAERQIFECAKGLDKKKYDVVIASLECGGEAPADLIESIGCQLLPFPVKRIYGFSGLREGLRFLKFLKTQKVDILITFHFSSDIWGPFWAHKAGVPHVISNRRDMGFWRGQHHVMAYKWISKFVDSIIVNAEEIKLLFVKEENLDPKNVHVISNGVAIDGKDTSQASSLRCELGIKTDDIVVVHVANLKPIKGHVYLLDAFSSIVKKNKHAKLVLIGEDKLEGTLQRQVQSLGINENVLFLGKQKSVSGFLSLSDICVLSSLSEGMSNAILEYMAAGKPVVATRVGGNPELVEDGVSGFLVDSKNSESLEDALSKLIDDPVLRAQMGAKGKDIVDKKYSMSKMISCYEVLFDQLITETPRILHLISSGGLFGAEKVLLTLAQHIEKVRMKSIVGALSDVRNPHVEVLHAAEKVGLPIWKCKSTGRFDLFLVFRIYIFIKKNHIKLLHTHNYKSDICGAVAAKWARIPIVSTAHGFTDVNRKVSTYENVDRFFLKNFFDAVVVVTSKMLPQLKGNKKKVIPNGVLVDQFIKDEQLRIDFRHKYKIKDDEIVVGTVGRLSREKNQISLLKACFSFMRKNLSVKLLIVGDGPERDRLEQYAKVRHLEDRIIFTGIVMNVSHVYQAMDIFVLPSLTEGVPLTVLEAMASKLVVIATAVGGVPQLIKNDDTGILIELNQLDSTLKNQIEALIENKEKRQSLSDQAYEFVVKNYSLKNMCDAYSKIYEENLN